MNVLVVEDDVFTLKLVVSILSKNAFSVEAQATAKAALSYLEKGLAIDIILSDIMMPSMDGFTFLKQLKATRRLRRIPVLLCSALRDREMVVKGLEAGAIDYLVKPVKERVLLSKMEKIAGKVPGAVIVAGGECVFVDLLTNTLKRDGYRVLAAGSGQQALDLIKSHKVALIVSDVRMPGMDGFELLASVKESNARTPVILMSGRGEFSRDDVVAAGADDFIPKPFHNTQVLNRIEAHFK
ncbi:MAG: response regulator [Planctomycetota bacterium]